MNDQFMIYGAYGYTGKLIVEEAVSRGLKPLLSGRNEKLLKLLANKYQLDHTCLKVNDTHKWDEILENIDLVLNCAGPFGLTVEHVVPAALRNHCHYLDITGEIEVFRYIASLDKEAKTENVVMLPGVGFDVVPTDCLSALLKKELPSGNSLELAFQGNSGISRGTALSMARRYHEGGLIRVDGKLKKVPIANEVKNISFGGKDRLCMSIPWGDVYTAYHTTGIPNITVFTGVNQKTLNSLLAYKKLSWVAKTAVAQWIMRSIIRNKIDGPTLEKRKSFRTYLWGQLKDKNDRSITMEMETPESYHLTALTAVESTIRVLSGKLSPGYHTPAKAFGSNFILKFNNVTIKII